MNVFAISFLLYPNAIARAVASPVVAAPISEASSEALLPSIEVPLTLKKSSSATPDVKVATLPFAIPEVGTVGLTEEEASQFSPLAIYTTKFKSMREGFAGREDRVFMKLIVEEKNQKVLGCHFVSPFAGELVQLAAVAVTMGATKLDFDKTIAVHPTISEELVTMRKPTRRA